MGRIRIVVCSGRRGPALERDREDITVSRTRHPDAVEHDGEPLVAVEASEGGMDAGVDQAVDVQIGRTFQPAERFLVLAETGMDDGERERVVIALACRAMTFEPRKTAAPEIVKRRRVRWSRVA